MLTIIERCVNFDMSESPTSLESLEAGKELKLITNGIQAVGMEPIRKNDSEILVEDLIQAIEWPIELLAERCIWLYTKETFLYRDLNIFLRQNDESKLQSYAPFVRILWLFFDHPSSVEAEPITVYRSMELDQPRIERYKSVVGSGISFRWPAFSSTSKKESVLLNGNINTLFQIHLKKIYFGKKKAIEIQHISDHPEEEEVLLKPGIEFSVEKYLYIESNQQHVIDLNAYI